MILLESILRLAVALAFADLISAQIRHIRRLWYGRKRSYGVYKFTYNGFCGEVYEEMAPYKATFLRWSLDPGIAVCECTDGCKRLIPNYALINFEEDSHPEQRKTGVIFGMSCSSTDKLAAS